jgi:hypothetical protein
LRAFADEDYPLDPTDKDQTVQALISGAIFDVSDAQRLDRLSEFGLNDPGAELKAGAAGPLVQPLRHLGAAPCAARPCIL